MRCDYFIQTELVIEYQDKKGKLCTIYTNSVIDKGYVHILSDNDSDDDMETQVKKFNAEIERKIKENTYNKDLYLNGEWVKESYRKKYENYILKTFTGISKFLKIYKKISAWERN